MVWWIWAGVQILLTISAKLLADRGAFTKKGKPGSLDAPTSEIGRTIPIVFGTCKVAPNVLHFGNPGSYEYTRTGEFAGYTYHADIALGICFGPVDSLEDIIFDNNRSLRRITSGTPVDPALPRPLTLDGLKEEIFVNAPNLFGGTGSVTSEGGAQGLVDFHFGTEEQEINAFLEARVPDNLQSAWKRLAYAWFFNNGPPAPGRPFYFGTSGSLKPIHFVVGRFPSAANGTDTNRIPNSDGYDGANPAEMIYECLTDDWWGLKVSPAEINLESFQAAAQTLFDEGFGLSIQVDARQPTDETIADILRYIDADVDTNPLTGLLELNLVRADYDADELLVITPENSRELEAYRPTYRELSTGVKLKYTNNSTRNFVDDSAEWTNSANREITGEEKIESLDFSAICDPQLAAVVAFREGKGATLPFWRGSFRCDRKGFNLRKSSPFKLLWPSEGIDIVARVTTIDWGSLEDGEISVSFVEDVFNVEGDGLVAGTVSGSLHEDTSSPGGPSQRPDVVTVTSQSSTDGTLEITVTDEDGVVSLVEHRTREGDGSWSGWTTDGAGAGTYSATVPRDATEDGAIEFRTTYTDRNGDTQQIVNAAPVAALGGGGSVTPSDPVSLGNHWTFADGALVVLPNPDAPIISGVPVPPGGDEGDWLGKNSATDGDSIWRAPADFVEPTTATPEDIVNALIAAGFMRGS